MQSSDKAVIVPKALAWLKRAFESSGECDTDEFIPNQLSHDGWGSYPAEISSLSSQRTIPTRWGTQIHPGNRHP